jgi:hypothetical protein
MLPTWDIRAHGQAGGFWSINVAVLVDRSRDAACDDPPRARRSRDVRVRRPTRLMTTNRKVSFVLLGLAWIALGAALVGLIFTPRLYCTEGSSLPPGLLATRIGLIVAGCAVFLGLFTEAAEASGLFGLLKVIGSGGATVAAGAAIGIFSAHQTASWGGG